MKASLRAVVGSCLLCLTFGCSSDDADTDDDDGGPEQVSCIFPSDGGQTCVDYRGDEAFLDVLRNSCAQSSDGVLTEGEACPTAGVSGICADESSNRSRLFYYDVTDGLDDLGAACTAGGGTWSTP
jgi:hypothetical protein